MSTHDISSLVREENRRLHWRVLRGDQDLESRGTPPPLRSAGLPHNQMGSDQTGSASVSEPGWP